MPASDLTADLFFVAALRAGADSGHTRLLPLTRRREPLAPHKRFSQRILLALQALRYIEPELSLSHAEDWLYSRDWITYGFADVGSCSYRGKTLYINGKEVPQTDIGPFMGSGNEGRRMAGAEIHEEMLSEAKHQILKSGLLIPGREGTWRVLAGQYFAIGDNRDNSEDSRYWGAVPGQNVVGKASVVWMHWDTEGGFNWSRVGRIQ